MFTELRMRFGIVAALLAVCALALPAFASADPLGSTALYHSGNSSLRGTAVVYSTTPGPDGNVWFIDNRIISGDPAIGWITPSGTVTEYISGTNLSGLKAGSDPVAITTGPEGKLWFTDKGATPAIGVLDPASCTSECTVQEFSIEEKGGNPGSIPQGIVAGPGGYLWFSDASETTPAIGRIDPSTHTVEEFSITAGGGIEGSRPRGIVVGSDGNLWYVNDSTAKGKQGIAKFNPSTQEVNEFAAGEGSQPGGFNGNSFGGWGIVAGPDGNVWFTESGSNKTEGRSATGKAIGRIEPSGAITFFSAGLSSSSIPKGLTVANGKLWVGDDSETQEEQTIVLNAAPETLDGTYKLGYEGQETGWTGEGTFTGESGEGELEGWEGSGNVTTGSKEVKRVTTFKGELKPGLEFGCQPNCGIAAGNKIAEIKEVVEEEQNFTTIILTANASGGGSGIGKNLRAGSKIVSNVTTKSGEFTVGHTIECSACQLNTSFLPSTTISEVLEGGKKLKLSRVAVQTGKFPLNAGIFSVTGVTTASGRPSQGEVVSGTGIQPNTTVSACSPSNCENPTSLTLSKVPAGSPGKVPLAADLSVNGASAAIGVALEKFSGIGAGNIAVLGISGTTKSPPINIPIKFQGTLSQTDVEQMSCNGAGLTGTSPTCSVETTQPVESNAIDSVSTSGEITRYPISGTEGGLIGLSPGSDGSVWSSSVRPLGAGFGLVKFGIQPPGPTNKRTLSVTKSGTGAGTVKSKPKGINCAAACTSADASLYKNTVVTLTEKPAAGSTFTEWTGACSGSAETCTVTMSEAKSVGAVFGGTAKAIVNPKTLTLSKVDNGFETGAGAVKATGLYCEADCTATDVSYTGGVTEPKVKPAATATLTAVAVAGSTFTGWTGCDSETEGKCIVLMSSAKEVTAEFTALPKNTLTLTKVGYGTVKSKPKAIGCANTCSSATASLPSDTTIVLTQKAGTGSTFTGWSGACSGAGETCTVSMSAAKSVTATFTTALKPLVNPKTLTLTKAGSGYGTVKATGLTCEAACTSTAVAYYGGVTEPKPKAATTVTLTAISAPGSGTVAWSGCDSETEGKCVVSMSAAKEVTATFNELE